MKIDGLKWCVLKKNLRLGLLERPSKKVVTSFRRREMAQRSVRDSMANIRGYCSVYSISE